MNKKIGDFLEKHKKKLFWTASLVAMLFLVFLIYITAIARDSIIYVDQATLDNEFVLGIVVGVLVMCCLWLFGIVVEPFGQWLYEWLVKAGEKRPWLKRIMSTKGKEGKNGA